MIVVVGDPRKLEVVVDLLSTDAVKVKPGAAMLLENWGGEAAIRAQVRTVEPSAFTKVSALGIEEQRANVVADFVDPPGPLGDGYRVETRIIIWEAKGSKKARRWFCIPQTRSVTARRSSLDDGKSARTLLLEHAE